MVSNCNKIHSVQDYDDCSSITKVYNITLDDFYRWNPSLCFVQGSPCACLLMRDEVCVGVMKPSTPAVPATTAATAHDISTPLPIQTGKMSD